MGGILGGIYDIFQGSGPGQVPPSGIFKDATKVGQGASSYLQDVLGGKLGESDRFGRMSEVLRDKIGNVARTQRGQAGQFAENRGFLDSGALLDIFGGIDRDELSNYTQSIEELLFGMEQQGLAQVFEFLGGASNEYLSLAGLNTGNLLEERAANMQHTDNIASNIVGGFGGGGGGGGSIACWVARSVYGIHDPRWLIARHYVINIAPKPFYRFYMKHGKRIAGWLDRHAWAKRFVKPLFDWMVKKALK